MSEHDFATQDGPPLRLGVAGLGRGFMAMIGTLALHPRLMLAGCADPRAEARRQFQHDFAAPAYADYEDLCRDAAVQAIYVATPHGLHRRHVELAAAHGKHVLVEKPMALKLDDALAMSEAARHAGIALLVGHSHGFDAPVARTRALVASGRFGRLRMITAANYTDFLYRPRRREELDTEQGGGVMYSQASHQVDMVRLIAGGRAVSVRAGAGRWDPARPTESAYSAFLAFEDGVHATLTYSGHAHFDSDEWCGWVGETGLPKGPNGYGAARRLLRSAADQQAEEALKRHRGYGSPGYVGPDLTALRSQPRHHEHFGLLMVSCDGADLRPGPRGIDVYADERQWFEPLPVPTVPRAEVIDELYAAAMHGERPVHSGLWGCANLEVCLAMLRSAREGREIMLHHQVGIADEGKDGRTRPTGH